MVIERVIKRDLKEKIQTLNKVFIVYGPRQVGKTTLVKEIIAELPYKSLYVNADETKYIEILSSRDSKKLNSLIAGYDLLFIDEAQRVPEIGINLKIIYDIFPNIKIIVTGSSSFELANNVSEPLTGRTWTYNLYPIAYQELKNSISEHELNTDLEERLVYGSYPEVFSLPNLNDKRKYLFELSNSYLFKDIFEISNIKKSNKINSLLKLLAFQIGSEVSLSELSSNLEMDKETVIKYIDLLEKSFVIFRLGAFNRKLRKEVTTKDKIYFYDLGVRNTIIDNLKPLKDRDDQGALWENFLIMERIKLHSYSNTFSSKYFWRTYTGAELDYIEDMDGVLNGYEFKWNNKRPLAPQAWLDNYPESKYKVVNKENYLEFITD